MKKCIQWILGVFILLSIGGGCGGHGGGSSGGPPPNPKGPLNKARGFSGCVQAISPATDGSGDLYYGGDFQAYESTMCGGIVRLNSDGTADTAFAVGSGFSGIVWTVAAANDGSDDVYVGGNVSKYQGTSCNYIVRLNSDGTQDTAFPLGTGFDNQVYVIVPALDGSGDVYIGGYFTHYNGTACNGIVRLNSNGTIDAGFAIGSGLDVSPLDIMAVPDGSGDIYVGGNFSSYNGGACKGIVRINPDGTMDSAFVVGTGFVGGVYTLAWAGDGSGDIYAGGSFTSYQGTSVGEIIRLNNDGSADSSFATGSGYSTDASISAIAAMNDGSGRLYVGGGLSYQGVAVPNIVRLLANGGLDPGFNSGVGFNDVTEAILVAGDGSGDLLVGGWFTAYKSFGVGYAVRLNTDGSVDTGIPVGAGFNYDVASIVAAPDGSGDIFVAGDYSYYNGTPCHGVARLNPDGTLDSSFSPGTGFDEYVYVIVPEGGGSTDMYVGGAFTVYNGTPVAGLIRINADGSLDSSFSTGAGIDGTVYAILPRGDGSGDIYVSGGFGSYNGTASSGLIRIHANGTPDAGFSIGSGFNWYAYALALVPDGSGDLYVGGDFTTFNGAPCNGLVRLNPDGTIDATLSTGSGFNACVSSILPADDGSGDIYVTGAFTQYNGTSCNRIVRLNPNGSVDSSFSVGTGFDNQASCMVLSSDGSGDIYISGIFGSYSGSACPKLVRLKADGTRDTTFAVGAGPNQPPACLLSIDTDGSVIAGGLFTVFGTTVVGRIVRLRPDGSLD